MIYFYINKYLKCVETFIITLFIFNIRGGGTGEAGEATASLEFRAFTTDKF